MSMHIISDSCCDLTPAMESMLQVKKVSFKINVGEQYFVDDGSVDTKELIAAMKAYSGPATTACPSPEEFAQCMRSVEGDCFVITLSAPLSGSYNSAMVARDMVLEDMPDKKIHVFNSESAAAGETLLALVLRDFIDAGVAFDEIVTRVEKFIETLATRFVLEDLGNLIKNGRITKVAGLVGTMLNLRPVMGDDGHGEIIAFEKVRGTQNALRRLVALVAKETADKAKGSMTMVLSHCNCAERAADLRKDLLAQCQAFREIVIVPTGALSTVYANDGGIVLGY